MKEFSENNEIKEETVESEELSTIFSDPSKKQDSTQVKEKGRLKKVIIALCLVAALIIGTIAVVKLIPVIEQEESEEQNSITALNLSTADIKDLSVTNPNGTFNFYPITEDVTNEDGETESEITWCVEGVDKELTSSSEIAGIVGEAAFIEAMREITGRTAAECGLDEAKYSVAITTKDDKAYSIKIGAQSADGLGSYLSSNDKIYLVEASVADSLDFSLLDLANASNLAKLELTGELSAYISEADETRLESFDSITISGANFNKPVVINMLEKTEGNVSYSNYVISSHDSRIADDTAVATLFSFLTDSVSLTGAYSFENTDAARKAVGLDNPYITATLKVGNVTRTIKISKVDQNNCAIILNDSPMIYKTSHSSVDILEYTHESFFGKMIYLENLKDVSNLEVLSNAESYSFDIAYNEEAEEKFNITYKDKKVTTSDFQSYYEILIGLQYEDFVTEKAATKPEITVNLKLKDGTTDTLKFYKSSATRYTCELNGGILGRVSLTEANKLLKNAADMVK